MTETYTSGAWIVKRGEEEAFVQAWTAFVRWAREMPGSGTFRLVRDLDHPNHYMSFAP
jgi:heme-degrading monooxygenase HmoA